MLRGSKDRIEFPGIGYRRVVDLESLDVELDFHIERQGNDVKIDGREVSAASFLQYIQKMQTKLRQLFLVLESIKWRVEEDGVSLGVTQCCENSRNRERVHHASGRWGTATSPISTESNLYKPPMLPRDYVGPRSEFVLDLGIVPLDSVTRMAKDLPQFLFVVFTNEWWSKGRTYVEFDPQLVVNGTLNSKHKFVQQENVLKVYF